MVLFYLRRNIALCISCLFGLIMIFYYWYILLIKNVPTDIQYHVEYVSNNMCVHAQAVPAHPGFYYTVWLLAGFTCDYNYVIKVAVVLIGTFWGIIVYASAYVGKHLISDDSIVVRRDDNYLSQYIYVLSGVFSCIIYSIPIFKYYFFVGLLPPNIYSNSTWICGLPFSIMAFGFGIKQIKAKSITLKPEIIISFLLVISALFKPSFAFVFIPSYIIMRASQLHWSRWYLLLLPIVISVLPTLLLIAGQTVWIISNPETLLGGKTSFVLDLPAGWHYTLPNLPTKHVLIRFLCSFALPIAAYVLNPKWLKNTSHQFAILCTVIGFLIFMTVHETGVRALHANFIWQVIYGNHMLHWIIIISSLEWRPQLQKHYMRQILIWFIITMHIISGIVYLASIPIRNTYY